MSTHPAAVRIEAWEDDPGPPDGPPRLPVAHPVPQLPGAALPVAIAGHPSRPGAYQPDRPAFRYWGAADALRRTADTWSAVVPAGLSWHPTVGPALTAHLDDPQPDFNAYYDRQGLHFFHDTAGGHTIYSGESPDVVCHEAGHAVLDALRPELFDAAYLEVAAFHEAFGDISAMVSALSLGPVRTAVIAETQGNLHRSSRVSRLAEQLGWAIRQLQPAAADPDCLRNAVNSFTYTAPSLLPSSAPASALCAEPHSFSRIFTGAFLGIVASMFEQQPSHDAAALLGVATEAAALLVDAATTSPVVPGYFSQLAAHLLEADQARNGGAHLELLRAECVARGLLSISSATVDVTLPLVAPTPAVAAPGLRPLDGFRYGLDQPLWVVQSDSAPRFRVRSAGPAAADPAPDLSDAGEHQQLFVDHLYRRGELELPGQRVPRRRRTHRVARVDGRFVLVRQLFRGR